MHDQNMMQCSVGNELKIKWLLQSSRCKRTSLGFSLKDVNEGEMVSEAQWREENGGVLGKEWTLND